MQLDYELTLDKSIAIARQSEEVKRQQAALRSSSDTVALSIECSKGKVGRP